MLLKNRIIIFVAIVIFSTNLLVSLLLGLYLKQQKLSEIEKEYVGTIDNISANVNQGISKNIIILEGLSQNLSSLGLANNQALSLHSHISPFFIETIKQNREIRDFFIIIEPDIMQKNDSSVDNFFDEKNRYIPHWRKNSNDFITVTNFDLKNREEIYKETKSKLKTTLFAPYMYRKDGKNVLKFPIATPIMYGNKFIGIIGFEISLNWIYKEITNIETVDGEIVILTNSGTIIAVSNNDYLKGKFITDYFSGDLSKMFFELKKARNINEKLSNSIFFANPFELADTGESWQAGINIPKTNFWLQANTVLFSLIFIGLFVSVFMTATIGVLIAKITKPLQTIESQIEKLIKGEFNFNDRKKFLSGEMIRIHQKLFQLQDRLNTLVKINYKIARREYTDLHLDNNGNENDMLAKSINFSINEIVGRWKTREIVEENKQKNSWLNQGIEKIQQASKIGTRSIEEVSDNIVDALAKFLDAYLTGMFIYNSEKNKKYLIAISTYAYENKKVHDQQIELNEGLIGTVAQEKKEIYLEKIPNAYRHIISGMGQSLPKSIMIFPLIYEDELLGVMEMAFLRTLNDTEKDFIITISEHIALTIKTMQTNKATNELLEKSRQQTKEIEKARKELEANLKKIKKSQEEAEIREAEMKGIINAVDNTILTIEYTTDGILLNTNKKYLETMHFELKDLKGVNVLDLVKTERDELENVIRRVSKGEFVEKLMKRFTKYGEVKWLLSTYTPFYNVNNEITKILYFAVDVTESKLQSEKLEAEIQELKNQLNSSEL